MGAAREFKSTHLSQTHTKHTLNSVDVRVIICWVADWKVYGDSFLNIWWIVKPVLVIVFEWTSQTFVHYIISFSSTSQSTLIWPRMVKWYSLLRLPNNFFTISFFKVAFNASRFTIYNTKIKYIHYFSLIYMTLYIN